jgi:hypothetical protein
VGILIRERQKGKIQELAAASGNPLRRKTVAKNEGLGKLSSPLKRTRLYSTRADPFAEIWAQADGMLEKARNWNRASHQARLGRLSSSLGRRTWLSMGTNFWQASKWFSR